MVPGMQHCGGGSGPNTFGQLGVAQGDPQHDIGSALERWVENGIAPEQIIATKYKSGRTPQAVSSARGHSARIPKWRAGTEGSTDDAANFTCAKPVVAP